MQQLPRHAQYKESGLPWVGEIPAHWQTRRNRFLFREVDRRSKHGEETHLSMSQVHGLVPSKDLGRKSLQSENYAGGKLVAEHDLVLNRLKAHLGVFARAKQAGVVSPDYTVFRPKGDASVRYCESLFKTPMYVGEFRRRTKGIVEGFWRLYTDDFYNVTALLPPPEEQGQIVAYLRAQDAHIARFIKTKRDLIKLLTEQKLRIIDHAVTRGLDATVTLKPSGIEWLGEVPEHWEVLPLRRIIRVKSGDMIHASEETEEGFPIYGGNGPRGYTNKVNCHGPMLLIGRVGAKCGCIHRVEGDFWASEHALRVIPLRKFDLEFFEHLLRWVDFNRFAIRTAQPLLNSTIIREQICAVPPVLEQVAIRKWIADECKPLDDAITRIEEEIKLIREYRDRLIADVVTGQVDVRDWQPGLDDVVDDAALAALGDDSEDVTEEEDGDGED